jgi:hypothetical protein
VTPLERHARDRNGQAPGGLPGPGPGDSPNQRRGELVCVTLSLTILGGLSPEELSAADRAMTVMRSNLRKALAGRA